MLIIKYKFSNLFALLLLIYLGDYANPRDATEIPPELPARPKSGLARPKSALSTKSTVKMQPKKAKVVTPLEQQHQKITEKSSKSAKKSTNKNTMSSKFSPMFKPCMNVNQRRVIKYNFLLSVAINVLILALGGTGFISVLSTEFKRDANYQYGKFLMFLIVCMYEKYFWLILEKNTKINHNLPNFLQI